MNDTNILKEVIEFILEERGSYDFIITPETELYLELEIWGDDSVEFINAFSEKFDVNIENFSFDLFFKGEGIDLFSFFKKKTPKKIIRVKDLVKSVKLRELRDENIE
jgi:acyl carrier protein